MRNILLFLIKFTVQMTKHSIFTIVAVALIIISFLLGRYTKKCGVITKTTTLTDTVYSSYPLVDTFRVSVPYNRTVNLVSYKTTHDTEIIERVSTGFVSSDTLRHNDLFVSISDTGDCNGITKRGYRFGGNIKERIITNTTTNEITLPPPFITLMAGAGASFSNKWKSYDISPTLSANIRNRYYVGYSYGINTNTHIVTLQTKIK